MIRALLLSLILTSVPTFAALTVFERKMESLVSLGDLPDPRQSVALSRALGVTWPLPASSLMTPTAFGAEWKDFFAGLGVETRARFGTQAHSTLHLGFGVGRADTLGLEVSVSSYGLARRAPPFATGGVSLKLHRFFPSAGLATAVGYDNAIVWSIPDSGQSYFFVASKYFRLSENIDDKFALLTIHLGVGDGRYRRESDTRARRQVFSVFGGAAIRIFPWMSFISNWTGSDLALGASISPMQRYPVVATLAFQDLTGLAGNGVRVALLFSYGDTLGEETPHVSLTRARDFVSLGGHESDQ